MIENGQSRHCTESFDLHENSDGKEEVSSERVDEEGKKGSDNSSNNSANCAVEGQSEKDISSG